MTAKQKILVVGGGGQSPPADGPALSQAIKASTSSPGDLKNVLQTMIDEASVRGYEVRVMQLADENKSLEWVEEVRSVLTNSRWDGFIIGNGIRGTPSLTLTFERLVAIGREVAPETPMGFNTHPMNVLEAIERICPRQ